MVIKKKIKNRNEKELYWIVGCMILGLAILISIPLISKSMKSFDYEGLTFTKEMYAQIPVYHYYYYFRDAKNESYQYNLYLRNDPRENTVKSDEIEFSKPGSIVYITINTTGLTECANASREVATLASFIGNNMFKTKSGVPDKEFAKQNNLTYIYCNENSSAMTLLIQKGEENMIQRENECYKLIFADCPGLLNVVERFEVQSILSAKNGTRISN